MGMEKKGEGRVNIPLLNEGTKMAAMPRRRQRDEVRGDGARGWWRLQEFTPAGRHEEAPRGKEMRQQCGGPGREAFSEKLRAVTGLAIVEEGRRQVCLDHDER